MAEKKTLGKTRKLDSMNRVIIPQEARQIMGVESGDDIEMFMQGQGVYLEKEIPFCVFCDSEKDILELDGIHFCESCGLKIAKGYANRIK